MTLMFFQEHWKLNVDSKIAKKIPEKNYDILDNLT